MTISFKKNKFLLMLVALLSLSLLLAACGGGDDGDTDEGDTGTEDTTDGDSEASGEFEEQHWRFISEELQGEVQYEYTAEFARRIEEKTNGAITVEPLEYGALGSTVDQAHLLQQGGVELAIVSPGFIGGEVPDAQIFSLHYLFPPDQELAAEIYRNSEAINVGLRERYEEHNYTPLAFWSEGQYAWTSNHALESPEDWEGLNMRVHESPLMREVFGAYGATVQALDWSELYTALDRETVDVQENPIFFIESAGFHEVQDYMIIPGHNNYVTMTTVQTEWYNSLDDNVRELIDETVDEMYDWAFEEQLRQNEAGRQAIEEDTENPTEVIELTEEQIEVFREAALPVHDYYRNEVDGIDQEIFDQLVEEIEEITNQ